mgnify:CR=1 FL=1
MGEDRGCGGCDCILAREAGGQVVGMCRCLPRSLDPEDRVRLRREVSAQRDELRALRSAVARVTAELRKQQHGEECPCAEHEECREMTDYDEPGHPFGWRCYQGLERAECERERVTCTCGLDALWRAVGVSRG